MTAALAIAATDPRWSHAPSPFHWQVLCYGGTNPRTEQPQPNLEVQFHKRTRPNGHGIGVKGILCRANDYAQMNHRSHFAVRDGDGRVIFDGPVMDEIEAPRAIGRLTDAELSRLSQHQRQYARENRKVG